MEQAGRFHWENNSLKDQQWTMNGNLEVQWLREVFIRGNEEEYDRFQRTRGRGVRGRGLVTASERDQTLMWNREELKGKEQEKKLQKHTGGPQTEHQDGREAQGGCCYLGPASVPRLSLDPWVDNESALFGKRLAPVRNESHGAGSYTLFIK